MGHQYSSAPSYGSQYPPAPFYSPFAPVAGQQVGTATPSFQQMNVHQNLQNLSPVSNQTRYDSNAQIQPQPTPLPFPSHFNPELLKHFPPPPPIPPGHFAPVPGNVANFAPFPPAIGTPPIAIPQHTFNHFPQPTTPLGGTRPSTQVGGLSQDSRAYGQPASPQNVEDFNDQNRTQFPPALASTDVTRLEEPNQQTSDGAVGTFKHNSRPMAKKRKSSNYLQSHAAKSDKANHHPSDFTQQPSSLSDTADNVSTQHSSQAVISARSSQTDLKERAKAALLSLVPHNIRYSEFLKEGVSADVLQQLYDELGLNWRSQNDASSKTATGTQSQTLQHDGSESAAASSSVQPSQTLNSTVPNVARISPAIASMSRSSPAASPGIERKDRIAQLLAARASKNAVPATASQADAPASRANSSPTNSQETLNTSSHSTIMESAGPNRKTARTDTGRQAVEVSNREAGSSGHTQTHVQVSEPTTIPTFGSQTSQIMNFAPLQVTSLPTPVREQIARSGLGSLIPGLFMTSAETEEYHQSEQPLGTQRIPKDKVVSQGTGKYDDIQRGNTVYISQPTRKRSRSIDRSEEEEEEEEEEDFQKSKRHAAQSGDFAEVDMDRDDASEGEILEDEAEEQPQHRNIAQPAHVSGSMEAAPPPLPQSDNGSEQKHTIGQRRQQAVRLDQGHVPSPMDSTANTPTLAQAPHTSFSSPASKIPDVVRSASKQEDRVGLPPVSLIKMTPEQIKEKAAKAKEAYLRQRALRQRQLQEGIPFLNDEVAKTQTKLKDTKLQLAQIQGELKEHEVVLMRAREDERRLQEEVQQLERQISEGLSGQKQFSNELNDLKQQSNDDSTVQSRVVSASADQPTSNESEKSSKQRPTPPIQSSQGNDSNSSEGVENITNTGFDGYKAFVPDVLTSPMRSQIDGPANLNQAGIDTTEAVIDMAMRMSSISDASTNDPLEFKSSVASAKEEIVVDETNDSDEAMEESDEESDDSHMSIDDDTDDSASMSDSGSDNYEPAEPEIARQDGTEADSEEYEPDVVNEEQFNDIQGDTDNIYEPVENASHESISTGTSDLTTTQSPSVRDSLSGEHTTDVPALETTGDVVQDAVDDEQTKTVEQEKGLQSSESDTLTKLQDLPQIGEEVESQVLGSDEVRSIRYMPYQSPLSSFRSYRFHPFFNEQVKDGYRSLTYSHKIDPKLPICLKELEGEACTDPECQDQHFGSMALPDDKILVQMSSANDIKDRTLRDQYLLGLKQVIARLRQEGVKEFSAVADALSQYRREWTAAQLTS